MISELNQTAVDQQVIYLFDRYGIVTSSVADPGCLSRILIFIPPESRIQQQHQKRRGEKFVVLPFFVATNITKLKNLVFN